MEDASKALLISASVLLAMLILSMVLLVFNNISSLRNAQADKTYQEQLNAFNMQFEAYNKKIMYGTDVISVVNKAIDNNLLMRTENSNDANYINIRFTINQEMMESTKVVRESRTGRQETEYHDNSRLPSGEYNVGTINMNENLIDFFNDEAKQVVTKSVGDDGTITTTTVTPAIINFKKLIFTCTGVNYNENTGRINQLVFKQVD